MGDGSSNRLSLAEISTPESPSKDSLSVDSLSNEWTDEKHVLFLNSIEASFVNQFYNDQCHSKDFLGWLSRINKHKVSSGPHENNLKSGQFKVLRKGCWENILFKKDNNSAKIDKGSFTLSANPWIQHFRAPFGMKERHFKSSYNCDDTEFLRSSDQLAREVLDGDATVLKHNCHQDSSGSTTEMSDQNFIADELIVGKQMSRLCRKRKTETELVPEQFNDQVMRVQLVPSRKERVRSSSDKNHSFQAPVDAESGGKTNEIIAGFPLTETEEASSCKIRSNSLSF